jgi:hypothetical protein
MIPGARELIKWMDAEVSRHSYLALAYVALFANGQTALIFHCNGNRRDELSQLMERGGIVVGQLAIIRLHGEVFVCSNIFTDSPEARQKIELEVEICVSGMKTASWAQSMGPIQTEVVQ